MLHFTPQIQTVVNAKPATYNHIVVVDVSGSMYGELPHLRKHLKNRIVDIVGQEDTFSLLYFSGRGEFGVLLENEKLNKATDLTRVHKAIDRYLTPIGLTGFKEPLEACVALIDRLPKDKLNSFVMMTDGYDNQWSQADILKAAELLAPKLDISVMVEYGWYCNRPLITKIAEILGGGHCFAQDFQEWEPLIENSLQRPGSKKVRISVPKDVEVVYYTSSAGLVATHVTDGHVLIPNDITVYYTGSQKPSLTMDVSARYLNLYHAWVTRDTTGTWEFLKEYPDVYCMRLLVNAFSKQERTRSADILKNIVLNPQLAAPEGLDATALPNPDAFTLVNFLQVLASDENNLFYPNHESFSYKKISRDKEQSDGTEQIEAIKKELAETTDRDEMLKLADKLKLLTEKTGKLEFKPLDDKKGYPIQALVFNEDRPNVSIRVFMEGTVEIPKTEFNLPKNFPTNIWRNYTIIRDGILNTRLLPVTLTAATIAKLTTLGLNLGALKANELTIIDLSGMPMVNQNMVKSVSLKEMADIQKQILRLQARQKVLKAYTAEEREFARTEGFSSLYGEAAAEWLKTVCGITDSGFNPLVKSKESTDFYMSVELSIAIKGASSLASVAAVQKKIEALEKKATTFNIADTYMAMELEVVNSMKKEDQLEALKTCVSKLRELQCKMAQLKYGLVIGQSWFTDVTEENPVVEITYTPYKEDKEISIPVTAKLQEKEIPI